MVTQLADDVWWLDLGSVNCYLADDGGDLTLVDAGTPFDSGDIMRGVREVGYSINDVDRVLLTHYDFDHVGSLARLPLNAPVYAGAADAPLLSRADAPDWHNHKGALQRVTRPLLSSPDEEVRPIEDGDEIGSFTAYATPGHSPGHTAYVSESLSVAFLGDLVRENHGKLEPSSWAISYDTEAVYDSIVSLDSRTPEFEVAAMGHGVPFLREGSERLRELVASM
ncbi:MBL fold hydrolase [Haladaptatus sp. W1]|uniref:MBL fold metallo-hydrolase n=1 Tax=Haladaptatus sp. W1 TaxID=1897478 RepID=UPI000849C2DA|nr:MBL fold metallo-hydrolase [Haladaptatus sp. W1]ODR82202.1 MBL fold hydrolase [Haladaptatus sp. W1]